MKAKIFKIMAAAAVAAMLAGCSQNQVLATLEASVAATEVVVEALAVSGRIPPEAAAAIEGAIAQLPDAYKQTTAELTSTDAAGVKAVKIAGYYAATLTALQGVPDSAKVYASAIADSISAFLSKLGQGQAQMAHVASAKAQAVRFDAKELKDIDARASALGERLAALKAARVK